MNKRDLQYQNTLEALRAALDEIAVKDATADGIVMATAIGAATTGMEWIQLIPIYYSNSASIFIGNIEDIIMVNKEGNRFVKEDGRRDEVSAAELKQKDKGMFMLYTAALEPNFNPYLFKTYKDTPYSFHGKTLAELAEKMGVPVANLENSIAEYNDGRKDGKDKFGRSIYGAEFDTKADSFWATWTHPFVHHTMGGIKINPKAQVLDTKGNAIPGLFAAGEVTGGLHGTNRLGGNAITETVVYGRIAGQNAVK